MTYDNGPTGPNPPGVVPPDEPVPPMNPPASTAGPPMLSKPLWPSIAQPAAAGEAGQPEPSGPEPVEQESAPAAADTTDADADETKVLTPRQRGAHRVQSPWGRYRAKRAERRSAKAAKPHRKAPWWELPALVALAILIAILVKTFVIQPFYIPSESMEHTLHGCAGCSGDRILVNKLIYDFRDPHPGDIVVFHAPPGWDDEPTPTPPSNPVLRVIRGFGQLIGFVPPDGQVLVKRVIATGGEAVKGDLQGHVYVQDPGGPWRMLSEPYVFRSNPGSTDAGHAQFGPLTVPKGRLWVMGDHRDDSADSRFHCGPGGGDGGTDECAQYAVQATVPVDDVIGKAFVIAWPPSRWRTLGTPSTFEATAMAGAQDVPGLASAGFVLPLMIVRRRRRRRRGSAR